MKKVIIDIETKGGDFDQMDQASQDYFLRFADTDEKREEARSSLSFYPLTAEVITIGMLEADSDKAFVFYQNGNGKTEKFQEGNAFFISGSEREILSYFWGQLKTYSQFVTFNGRTFDCPFLMIRSAVNKIRASKNLVPYRYAHNIHVDLADQLSFYDALRRKFSLHMWCQAFDIESPKNEGVTGLEVAGLYGQGHYKDIARYCLRDIEATKKLYFYWENYIKFDR